MTFDWKGTLLVMNMKDNEIIINGTKNDIGVLVSLRRIVNKGATERYIANFYNEKYKIIGYLAPIHSTSKMRPYTTEVIVNTETIMAEFLEEYDYSNYETENVVL